VARDLHADVVTAVTSAEVRLAWATDLVLDSGELNLWQGVGDMSANSNTYSGVGSLGVIEAIEETTDLKATGIRMTLSGVASSLISVALDEDYQGRTLRAYLCFFDTDHVLIGDAVLMFAGRMDVMTIVDTGDEASIQLTAESRAVDLERVGEAFRYTDEDQQRLFTGDLGCRFVEELVDKSIAWGRVDLKKGTPG
tara:strand:+ start:849 stop:1436 length:588 start_codon:yes stop_codon:yes gene_type:complete